MAETVFPQAPNWFLSKILSTRVDGSVAYGSQNDLIILKRTGIKLNTLVINDAHNDRITSVSFSPVNNNVKLQNLLLSSSDDGFVKLYSMDTLVPIMGHNSHKGEKEAAVVKVVCASWSNCNGQYIVSAADNDTLVLWDAIANTTTKFLIPKLKPTVVECSYHNEKIVAVGSMSGLVYIIKLVKKGEVIYKLRGHDKEIQALCWCPTFSKFDGSNIFERYLLASSSQEKEIFIWRTQDGVCEVKIQLPKSPLSKTENLHHGKWDASMNVVPLFWRDTYVMYSGTRFGELISCDLRPFLINNSEIQNMNEKEFNKIVFNSWKLSHNHHSKALLVVSGYPNCIRHENHGNDCDDKKQSKGENTETNCDLTGGNERVVGDIIPSTNATAVNELNLIWTIGRDMNLVAVYENTDNSNPVFNLHTLNGHAFEAAVSPHNPNQVAIASGDAKIRVWNASKQSGHTLVYWQKINDRAYSLAWHPTKERIIAHGTSEGRVGLIEIYSQKVPVCFKTNHCGKVYRLAWGPPYSENDECVSHDQSEFWLYSVGGYKLLAHNPAKVNAAAVHIKKFTGASAAKLTDLCWKPDYMLLALAGKDGNVYICRPPRFELVYTLESSKKLVQSLVWHPTATTLDADCAGFHGYFTFGSTDRDTVIKVYNYFKQDDIHKVEQVAALEGHSGYVQSVSWSPHIGGRLISAGADFSVRIWDVTTNTQLAKFIVSQSVLPLFSIWSPIDPDVIITGYAMRMAASWRISTINNIDPIVRDQKEKKTKTFEMSELLNSLVRSGGENGKESCPVPQDGICGLSLAKNLGSHGSKSLKEKKMFMNAWKSDIDTLKNSYELLIGSEGKNINFILPFLDSETVFSEFLNAEAESHEKSSMWTEYYQLAMWRGNLNEVIEEKIKTGHLDDFLLSLAPFISPRLWREACIAYAKTLTENKSYRKAACYLLAACKIKEAIDVLANSNLYLEALCIARCRFPDSDPVVKKLIRNYADWLTKTGSFLKAAECLIFLEEYSEVANILLAKKDNPQYLSLAALAFKKAGSQEKERQYSFSALLLALTDLNLDLAERICNDHYTVQPLSMLYETHFALRQFDSGEVKCDEDLINYLKNSIGVKGDESCYKFLSYIYDKNTLYNDKKKLYVTVARELCLAICTDDKDTFLTHVLRALNAASKYTVTSKDEISFLFKLCSWLSPNLDLSEKSIFCSKQEIAVPKITSLRAFLCQGIAEHLDFILNGNDTNIDQNLVNSLKELVCDVLNKDAFIFFKNQLEIKSSETRINMAYQRNNGQISENHNDGKSETQINGTCVTSDPSEENINGEVMKTENGSDKTEIFESMVSVEMNKISRLKLDIKEFECLRFISPNPAYVYCILRRVSEMLPDDGVLAIVEEKWNELQTN